MIDDVLVTSRAGLAAMFLVAGAAKLADPAATRRELARYTRDPVLTTTAASLLPATEIATGALLVTRSLAWPGSVSALVLLLVFTAAAARDVATGRAGGCACFGRLAAAPHAFTALVRNVLLTVLAVFTVVTGWYVRPAAVPAWLAGLGPAGQRAAVCVLALFGLVLVARAARRLGDTTAYHRHRRTRPASHDASSALAAQPCSDLSHHGNARAPQPGFRGAGPAVGAAAPGFDLQPPAGGRLALRELLRDGRPLLLVFSDVSCGSCDAVHYAMPRWRAEFRGRLNIAMLAGNARGGNGGATAYSNAVHAVAQAYAVPAVPAAVLVNAGGRIASRLAVGALAIDELVRGLPPAGVDAWRASS